MRQNARSLRRLCAGVTGGAIFLLLGLALIMATPRRMSAQSTTADIVGTVTDQQGAVVPGADITVVNKGTAETRKVTSGQNGDYAVTALPPGTYSISITAPSFKKFAVPSLTLAAGDKPRVNAQMTIGDTTQTVSVEATTPLLQSESATMQDSVNQLGVQDMPLNGRNFVQLVQMVPGANEGPPNSLTNGAKPDDRRQSAAISANGQSDVLNNNLVDGMDNNERLIGSLGVRPSVDAISELRVQTSVYSADVGRTAGAVINIITKSGTNQFHGTLYEYFRNDIFNTYPYQFGSHNPKQELRQNQFGGSLGGPIIHNKTFFFGDYEGFRLVNQGAPATAFTPTAYEEQHMGDFSDIGGPVLTGPFDNAGVAYFKMFPTPTGTKGTQGTWVGAAKNTQYSTVFDARVDHQINQNNSLFARYSYNNVSSWVPGFLPAVTESLGGKSYNIVPGIGGYAPDLTHQAILSYVHTFSSNLLLTLQAGYLRVDNENYPPNYGYGNKVGPNYAAAMGMANVNVSAVTSGLPRATVQGGYTALGGTVFSPLIDFSEAYQYQGTVDYTHGAHTIKMGAQLIRRQATSLQSVSATPQWQFKDMPSLLQGNFVYNFRSLSTANPHYRWWETSAYIQDDYHVMPNLTLNLGVRYDVYTPKTAVKNQIANWDPVAQQIMVAGTNGVSPTTNIGTAWGQIQPRIGFAYTVRQGLVVRGGFGMVYYPTDITSNPSLKNPPFLSAYGPYTSAQMAADPNLAPYAQFQAGAPPATAVPVNAPFGPLRGVTTYYKPGEGIQYNLSVQKDWHGNVLTLTGVGVEGRHVPQAFTDINAPAPGAYASGTAAQAARPTYSKFSGLTTIAMYDSEGISHYYGGTVAFERRLTNGLSYSLNYTHSHELDNAIGMSNQGNEGYGYNFNKFDDRYEYGNSDLDLRDRMAGTITYALPFFKGAAPLQKATLGGWEINLLGAWAAGQPFTITNNKNLSGQSYGNSNADRPNLVGDPSLSGGARSVHKYFNTAAFQGQTLGTLGNSPRNTNYGPHYRHLDLSLIKTIPIRETANVEFRAEGYNITNSSNFATPNSTLGVGSFGTITTMSGAYIPRVLQFALKLTF